MRRLREILRDDRGLTLPELIVVCVLTVIVLITVGGMYLSTIRAERVVNDLSEGASSAQLVARSIDEGVRNGVYFGSPPVTSSGDGSQLLVVCTAGAGESADFAWQAWAYSPEGDGQLRTRSFDVDDEPGMPSTEALSTWTLLATGVEPRDASGVFGYDDDADPRTVTIRFDSVGELANSASIDFATNLAPAPTYASGTEPCT